MLGKDKILRYYKHGDDLILDTHDDLIDKIFIVFFNVNTCKELLRHTAKNINKILNLSFKELRNYNRQLFFATKIGDKTIKNLNCYFSNYI